MTILMTGGDRPLGEPDFCDECGFSVIGCTCGMDFDDEEDHEIMGFCDLEGCVMNYQLHFPSECFTPEMYEGTMSDVESDTNG